MHRGRSAVRPTSAPIGPGHGGFVEAGPSAPRSRRSARSADLALRMPPSTTPAGASMTVLDPADDGGFRPLAPCIPNRRFGRRGSRAGKARRATRWRVATLNPLLRKLRHPHDKSGAGAVRTNDPGCTLHAVAPPVQGSGASSFSNRTRRPAAIAAGRPLQWPCRTPSGAS